MYLELRGGVKHGLAAKVAEKLAVAILSVLLLRLEIYVETFLMSAVLGQLLFARVKMGALLALEFVGSQRIVEL